MVVLEVCVCVVEREREREREGCVTLIVMVCVRLSGTCFICFGIRIMCDTHTPTESNAGQQADALSTSSALFTGRQIL